MDHSPSTWRGRLFPLLGLCLVLTGLWGMARYWHPVYGFTRLLQLDRSNDELMLPLLRENPVFVYENKGGYDGLYYAQIATDPSLGDPDLPKAMDNLPYRSRRILSPALAWVFAGGDPLGAVHVYAFLNIGFWLLLALLLWRLLDVKDLFPFLAWAGLLFCAGVMSSFRLSLSDLPSLVLLAGALLLAEKKRTGSAVSLLALAILARETAVLGALGLKREFPRHLRALVSWLLLGLAAVLPFVLWLLYSRWRVGPGDQGWSNLHLPLQGFVEKAFECIGNFRYGEPTLLAWGTLLAFLALATQAFVVLRQRDLEDPWWRVGFAFVVLLALIGTPVWEGHPGAATRVLLPLHLAATVLLCRRSRSWLLLVGINLSLFSGLYTLWEKPDQGVELAALRQGEASAVLNLGENWQGLEQKGSLRWAWTAREGGLDLRVWPKTARHTLSLSMKLRALSPRTVKVLVEGREIAHWELGTQALPFRLERLPVENGHLRLVLHCDTPPAQTPKDPRPLGFCILQASLALEKK